MDINKINKLTSGNLNIAYNPDACVFVSANAGSGKTSLLASRVLSLLLHGVAPDKILCLTFTNAAAAEMSNRVLNALGGWVMADSAELMRQVSKLTNDSPSPQLLTHARSLFANVLESPQGVNIQTIHGFSQSLLRRFPLEAGVSPYFTVMDSRSEQEVLAEARLRLFNKAQNPDSQIQDSLDSLARDISEFSFHKLMNEIVSNKNKFRRLLHDKAHLSIIGDELNSLFKIKAGDSLQSLMGKYFSYDDVLLFKLRKAADILLLSEKAMDKKTGEGLALWLEQPERREKNYRDYMSVYLTSEGEARKKLFTKDALKDDLLVEALLAEQGRVIEFSDRLNALSIVRHSMDVLNIAESLLAGYTAIKNSHAWMDYDDLIMAASGLLTRAGMSPWVLFKLDGGIDHILVDEAQDTSPLQWQIIDALTQEFFAGQGASEAQRSLFIVGDEKQSIYSFQGADVKELARMQRHFMDSISAAQKPFHSLALTKSYRSTDAVLQAVDAIFSIPAAREGVTFGSSVLEHIPTRSGQPGLVELWPVVQPGENEEQNALSPTTRLVRHIADSIAGWIKRGEANAGEIMILLRRRTTLADRLVRALKRRSVAVAGSDRMQLNDNLAVQDLIALGQVMLLPDDDLTLASCLKSPIFNLSEDDLFTLAYNRGAKTLWQRLGEDEKFTATYELLVEMRAKADLIPPFELYSYLLDNKGARGRFIGRMGEESSDPIDEFMQQALLYERSHSPSLQGFMHWLANSNSEVKRDMEQARDAVRIMTIHGAKGLQAKIVILPDTMEAPVGQDSILWIDGIPVRALATKHEDSICKSLKMNARAESHAEYRRLLYVALTRAEDRLYICGASGKEKVNEKSWYHHVKTGLQLIAEPCQTPTGEGLRVGQAIAAIPAKDGIHLVEIDSRLPGNDKSDFSFLKSPAAAEPSPSKPLTPSRLSGEIPALASPLKNKHVYAAGKLIHLLLQYLPEQEVAQRKKSAELIAQKFASELSGDVINKAISDALKVIENPGFTFLFGSCSMAEVPITGNVEMAGKNITVSGQIDRLYMGEKEVWIVDFKSNQLPPQSQKNIPLPYIRQLALYRILLREIAPGKTVHCALLWTANAKLDVLDEALLDEWAASSYI